MPLLALAAFAVVATVMGMGEAWHWGVPAEAGYMAMVVLVLAQILLVVGSQCTTSTPEVHTWWLSTAFTLLAIMISAFDIIGEYLARDRCPS